MRRLTLAAIALLITGSLTACVDETAGSVTGRSEVVAIVPEPGDQAANEVQAPADAAVGAEADDGADRAAIDATAGGAAPAQSGPDDAASGAASAPPAAAWTAQPLPTATPTPWPTPTVPPTPTEDPFAVAGAPVRVEVPAIGVDATIEQVGLTADNAMDVPKSWMNVGWYKPGFRPGEPGNAVLAGHLDTNTGGPAVFWNLSQLQPGDEVHVTYASGDRYTFVVQGQENHPFDAQGPVIRRIFGESQTADLNLITCDGYWDRGQSTYNQRLVVFTTLAPERTVRADDAAGAGTLD